MPVQALDRAAWQALVRRPSEWQHLFGPADTPVVIAGTSQPIRALVDAIRALGEQGEARCVMVEGGLGSGKSLAATAFQADCIQRQMDAVFVHEGTDPVGLIRRLTATSTLVIDNLDRLSSGLRAELFKRRNSGRGAVITCSKTNALERELLGSGDSWHQVGRWDERPADVLIIAGLAWKDLGRHVELADVCGDGVAETLCRGPWPRGAHSVRDVIGRLAESLELEGYFEHSTRVIGLAEVQSALLEVLRLEAPVEIEDAIHILVEGSTDKHYLETAGRLAAEEWGTSPLSGCRVIAPGEDREGGADKARREMIKLEAKGITVVALFDDDDAGRAAAINARKQSGQKVHLLPFEFDPLRKPVGLGVIEIEDLLPLPLLEAFYSGHPACSPEERTIRADLTRIVVAGVDKDSAAKWICERASFKDMRKIVYVLCVLRNSIGLPLPPACPPLESWINELCT